MSPVNGCQGDVFCGPWIDGVSCQVAVCSMVRLRHVGSELLSVKLDANGSVVCCLFGGWRLWCSVAGGIRVI